MTIENPSYFSIIPANVRYDRNLSASQKLLYGEISALTNKNGYCWASNSYFADLYGVTTKSISRWISSLEKRGYISTSCDVSKGNARRIYLGTKMSIPRDKNVHTPMDKNVQHNNTSINNKFNTPIPPQGASLKKGGKGSKPTPRSSGTNPRALGENPRVNATGKKLPRHTSSRPGDDIKPAYHKPAPKLSEPVRTDKFEEKMEDCFDKISKMLGLSRPKYAALSAIGAQN